MAGTLHPSTRELEGRRLDNCFARLERHTEADLNLAVDGYSRFPFIVDKGRRSAFGTPSQWRADAELIFRDAEHVKQGMDLAQNQVAYVPHLLLEQISWRRIEDLNRKLLIAFLTECFGAPTDFGSGWLESPCPRCDDGQAVNIPLRFVPADTDLNYIAQMQPLRHQRPASSADGRRSQDPRRGARGGGPVEALGCLDRTPNIDGVVATRCTTPA